MIPRVDRFAHVTLAVVGKSASGKSTLCRGLQKYGFRTVSASTHLKQSYKSHLGETPTRIQLANLGSQLKRTGCLGEYHKSLLADLMHKKPVCVDGIRFDETLIAMKLEVPTIVIVFLDCPDEVREQRAATEDADYSWSELISHETETSIEPLRDLANFVVRSTKSRHKVVEEVLLALATFS